MLGSLVAFSSVLALVPTVLGADAPVWGQCGGQGWTGPTTCESGSTCKYSNDWYSQCIPGTAITTPSATPTQTSAPTPTSTSTSKTNYWFSFGDSYTATGFNINGAQPGPNNPLGNPAYPGNPTTPGPNWIDGATVTYNHSLVLTYNFAVGGATIDKSILPPYSGVSLTDEVNTFLNWNSGAGKGKWSSANAIFSVWIGINDIGGTYFKGGDRAAFSDTMLKTEFALIQKLYDVGARNFLFINVPPMERSPREISNSGASLQKSVINTHNAKYVTYVNNFASSNSGVKTWFYDSHAAFTKILDSLSSYGFSTSATSYGGANDFWGDNYHPSSKAQLLFAKDVGALLAGTPW